MQSSRVLSVVCVFLLCIVASPAGTSAGVDPAPDLDRIGPYEIGFTYFMLTDASRNTDIGGRPIPVYLWYPVDPVDVGATTEAVYPLDPVFDMVPVSYSSEWELYGFDRAYQEPPASPDGPFPTVVFSPGWGSPNWSALFVGTRLASHGFVVAVVYHHGDAFWPWEPFDHIAYASLNRPLDVSFVLTHLLDKNATQGDLLYDTIRPEQVAASGWSLGGYAAMVLAGGDDSVCDKVADWGFPGTPPETCVPAQPDPRIRAIVSLDGSTQFLWFDEMTRITVPTMGIGEEWTTLETVLGPIYGSQIATWQARLHGAGRGHPCYRVDVNDAYHATFSNFCEAAYLLFDKGIIDEATRDGLAGFACAAPLPTPEAYRLITKYMIAFLKTNLAGESGYHHVLTPGYALTREPDIEFFVTERRSPNAHDDDWPGSYMYLMHQPGSQRARADKDPAQAVPVPHVGVGR